MVLDPLKGGVLLGAVCVPAVAFLVSWFVGMILTTLFCVFCYSLCDCPPWSSVRSSNSYYAKIGPVVAIEVIYQDLYLFFSFILQLCLFSETFDLACLIWL